MQRKFKKDKLLMKEIAKQRIEKLLREADEIFKEDKELANRYVYLARKISMGAKVPIPVELKKKYCKHCHSFLVPSVNCRIRLAKSRVIYYCLECKKFMRFPYKGKSKIEKV